jgi:hypothetical protein
MLALAPRFWLDLTLPVGASSLANRHHAFLVGGGAEKRAQP